MITNKRPLKVRLALGLSTLTLGVSLVAAPVAFAQYVPVQPSKDIKLIKFVWNPSKNAYEEDVFGDEHVFRPNDEVKFKLEVRNTGQAELRSVQVRDKLPTSLDFVSGPVSYDQANSALNSSIDRLAAGETRVIEFTTRLKQTQNLEPNANPCFTNFAEARVESMYASDTAVFCIQNQPAPKVEILPKAGSVGSTLTFVGSLISLAFATLLIKKSKELEGVSSK